MALGSSKFLMGKKKQNQKNSSSTSNASIPGAYNCSLTHQHSHAMGIHMHTPAAVHVYVNFTTIAFPRHCSALKYK